MIEAMFNHFLQALERPLNQPPASQRNFAALFGDAAGVATPAATQDNLGTPDVKAWLKSYYDERQAAYPQAASCGMSADTSFEPAEGAGNNFAEGSVFGPDAIFSQALANQVGNAFASMTGSNAANFTSQLPGIPTEQAQQEFDRRLAQENLLRLQSGQPIDTTAYWSDPGPITTGGITYTSADLGYAGPAQSCGPQPIYISKANQISPDTFAVPGYSGQVTGIQPGRYYTLAQLEKAGLQSGQPDAQFHPGSWSKVSAG